MTVQLDFQRQTSASHSRSKFPSSLSCLLSQPWMSHLLANRDRRHPNSFQVCHAAVPRLAALRVCVGSTVNRSLSPESQRWASLELYPNQRVTSARAPEPGDAAASSRDSRSPISVSMRSVRLKYIGGRPPAVASCTYDGILRQIASSSSAIARKRSTSCGWTTMRAWTCGATDGWLRNWACQAGRARYLSGSGPGIVAPGDRERQKVLLRGSLVVVDQRVTQPRGLNQLELAQDPVRFDGRGLEGHGQRDEEGWLIALWLRARQSERPPQGREAVGRVSIADAGTMRWIRCVIAKPSRSHRQPPWTKFQYNQKEQGSSASATAASRSQVARLRRLTP